MVLELCGESISIPNGIADWCHKNPDNRTEFDGMIDSMIWAIKKKYQPNGSSKSDNNGSESLLDSLYKLYLSSLSKK